MCRHLEWDHDEHSVVLKSTHCKSQRSSDSQPDESALIALAVMSVWPLQFTGLLEVHKKVYTSSNHVILVHNKIHSYSNYLILVEIETNVLVLS